MTEDAEDAVLGASELLSPDAEGKRVSPEPFRVTPEKEKALPSSESEEEVPDCAL